MLPDYLHQEIAFLFPITQITQRLKEITWYCISLQNVYNYIKNIYLNDLKGISVCCLGSLEDSQAVFLDPLTQNIKHIDTCQDLCNFSYLQCSTHWGTRMPHTGIILR